MSLGVPEGSAPALLGTRTRSRGLRDGVRSLGDPGSPAPVALPAEPPSPPARSPWFRPRSRRSPARRGWVRPAAARRSRPPRARMRVRVRGGVEMAAVGEGRAEAGPGAGDTCLSGTVVVRWVSVVRGARR